jgi:hypothetical protein
MSSLGVRFKISLLLTELADEKISSGKPKYFEKNVHLYHHKPAGPVLGLNLPLWVTTFLSYQVYTFHSPRHKCFLRVLWQEALL